MIIIEILVGMHQNLGTKNYCFILEEIKHCFNETADEVILPYDY